MKALGLTDGSAGMNAQVQALAEAMGIEVQMHKVEVNKAWEYLPNAAYDLGLAHLFPVTSSLPEAKLIISCGRKGALASASYKGDAKRIHIQDPQMNTKHFDVVIVMEHDNRKGPNILVTPYALHKITDARMQAAGAQWEPKFSHLPRPWNAVLIGGSTNKYQFNETAMEQLISDIGRISGSLLITTSRRTGEKNIALLQKHFGGKPSRAFLYTGALENPYLGMLACADHIHVTNDSVNMMSEAVASGKPLSILNLQGHTNTKPARFAEGLREISTSPHAMMKEIADSVRLMLA
jgi:mitochondrial fission protein ELM1